MSERQSASLLRWQMVLLIGGGVFFVCTLSTTTAGFQALYPILLEQRVFASLCDNTSSATATATAGGSICQSQVDALERMFIISMALNNVWALIGGLMLQGFGVRITGSIGCLLYILGCVFFAFASQINQNVYILGYSLIGVGGITIFMSVLHIANAILAWRGTIMTLLLCGEDTSAGIFLVFQGWNAVVDGGVSLRTMFLSLASLPLLCLFYTWGVQPRNALEPPRQSDPHEYFKVRGESFRNQLLSLEFGTLLVWAAVGSTLSYFYIATLSQQLLWISSGDDSFSQRGQLVFSYVLVFAAIAATPFFGRTLDKLGTLSGVVVTGVLLALFSALSVIKNPNLQYFNFVVYTIARAVLFSMYGHLANLFFGRNFGIMIGAVVAVAGGCIFTNLLWANVVRDSLKGEFFIVNLCFGVVMIAATCVMAAVVRSRVILDSQTEKDRRRQESQALLDPSSLAAAAIEEEEEDDEEKQQVGGSRR